MRRISIKLSRNVLMVAELVETECGTAKPTQACRATWFSWVGLSFAHDLHKFFISFISGCLS
jgi:hypothetical protein